MTRANRMQSRFTWFCAALLWAGAAQAGAAPAVEAVSLETIAHFDPNGCRLPSSPLTLGNDGNLYGTMSMGGTLQGGCLYRVTPKGKFTVLHEFKANSFEEGSVPYGGLQLASDGSLIGTTASGGPVTAGTIFRFSARDGLTYLRMFGENPLGILGPGGAPIPASDGRLYGGIGGGGQRGGAIYSILEDGSDLRVHHYFNAGVGELYGPVGPLMQASDGMLYGSLVFGPFEGSGAGGVFRLSLDGDYRVLHTMNAVGDGVSPQSGVIQGADGALYGTNTSCGGDGNWCDRGTVFRISRGKGNPDFAKFKVLYTGNEFGTGPHSLPAGLLQMADGKFWSVSTFGGIANSGAVYRISPQGAMEVLSSFVGTNGSFPYWRLTLGADGWVYGLTQQGGNLGGGVVFRIKAD